MMLKGCCELEPEGMPQHSVRGEEHFSRSRSERSERCLSEGLSEGMDDMVVSMLVL